VSDAEIFNVSRARNAGAKAAKGKFLFFIDADVLINLDLGIWLAKQLQATPERLHCTVNAQLNRNLYGTHICKKSDFNLVNFYDEAFTGWGSEDVDLYFRLMRLDIMEINFPETALESLPHSNAIRQISKESGGLGSIKAQMIGNRLYMNIKYDLEILNNKLLSLPERQKIMGMVRDFISKELASNNPSSPRKLIINLPHRLFNRFDTQSQFTKQLVYKVHL
jgi:glycosyltransferase involved in cell wall biosynthesis